MNRLGSPQPVLLPALPIGAAPLAAVALDRDLWFAVPLAAVLTVVVGSLSFLIDRSGRWPLHSVIGGVAGWVASVAALTNIHS